jgi:hypothetical protein
MVTGPSKDMVTNPARPGEYVEAEVRLPAFACIYQAAAGDLEM